MKETVKICASCQAFVSGLPRDRQRCRETERNDKVDASFFPGVADRALHLGVAGRFSNASDRLLLDTSIASTDSAMAGSRSNQVDAKRADTDSFSSSLPIPQRLMYIRRLRAMHASDQVELRRRGEAAGLPTYRESELIARFLVFLSLVDRWMHELTIIPLPLSCNSYYSRISVLSRESPLDSAQRLLHCAHCFQRRCKSCSRCHELQLERCGRWRSASIVLAPQWKELPSWRYQCSASL